MRKDKDDFYVELIAAFIVIAIFMFSVFKFIFTAIVLYNGTGH